MAAAAAAAAADPSKEMEFLREQIETIKADHDNDKRNADQLLRQAELKIEAMNVRSNKQQDQISKLRATIEEQSKEIDSFQSAISVSKAEAEAANLKLQSCTLELEEERRMKEVLSESSALLQERLDQSHTELSQYADKVLQYSKSLSEAEMKLSKAELENGPLEFEVQRLRQGKELLEQQAAELQEGLNARSSALLSLQAGFGERAGQDAAQLEEAKAEAAEQRQRAQTEHERALTSETSAERLALQLADALRQAEHAKLEFERDVVAERRLSSTYKRARDVHLQKGEELEQALVQLRSELDSERQRSQQKSEAMQQKQTELEQVTTQREELAARLSELQEHAKPLLDLQTANDNATKRPVPDGLSLETVYSRLVETADALRHERQECRKLEVYVREIQLEVEQRLPAIEQERADHQRLLRSNHMLVQRLSDAVKKTDAVEAENRAMRQEGMRLVRSNEGLQKENDRICKQVQMLLMQQQQQEQKRKGLLPSRAEKTPHPQQQQLIVRNAAEEDGAIVPFKNVQELQERNRDLARLLHEQQQKHNNSIDADERQRYEAYLTELKGDISSRDQQLEVLEKQLGTFKSLLSDAIRGSGNEPQQHLAILPSADGVAARQERHDSAELLKMCERELEMLRTDKSEMERQFRQALEHARVQERDARAKLADANGSIAVANHKLGYLDSLSKRLQSEATRLRQENAKLSSALEFEQEKTSKTHTSASALEERLQLANVELVHLRAKLSLASDAEQRLVSEVTTSAAQLQRSETLLKAVQQVQNRFEQADADTKQRLLDEKQQFYNDWVNAQKQAAVERRSFQQAEKLAKDREQRLRSERDALASSNEKLEARVCKLESSLKASEASLSSSMASLASVQEERDAFLRAHTDGEGHNALDAEKRLAIELATSQELANTNSELAREREQQADDWKRMALEREKQVKELTDAANALSHRTDTQRQALEQRVKELQQHMFEADQERERMSEEVESARVERDNLQRSLTLQESLVSAARSEVTALEAGVNERDVELAATTAKYETELLSHAKAVAALNDMRNERQTLVDAASTASSSLAVSEQRLASSNAQWTERLSRSQELVAQHETALKALQVQNDLLLSQLENDIWKASELQSGVGLEADSNLQQIIAHLRSSKELAEQEAETANNECRRLKSELQLISNSRDEALQQLADGFSAAQQSKGGGVEAGGGSGEELALLRDSNRLLRADGEAREEEKKTLEKELISALAAVEPLTRQLQHAETRLQSLQREKEALANDIETWRTRNQQLLKRYHQVDPEVHQAALDDLQAAKAEVDAAKAETKASKLIVAQLQSRLREVNSLKDDVSTKSQRIAELESFNQRLQSTLRRLRQRLVAAQKQLEGLHDAPAQLAASRQALASAATRINALVELSARCKALLKERDDSTAAKQVELEQHRRREMLLQRKLEKQQKELLQAAKVRSKLLTQSRTDTAMVEKLQQENRQHLQLLEEKQQLLSELQTTSTAAAASTSAVVRPGKRTSLRPEQSLAKKARLPEANETDVDSVAGTIESVVEEISQATAAEDEPSAPHDDDEGDEEMLPAIVDDAPKPEDAAREAAEENSELEASAATVLAEEPLKRAPRIRIVRKPLAELEGLASDRTDADAEALPDVVEPAATTAAATDAEN